MKTKTKNSWASLRKEGWTPVRKGDVYCSPFCGGNCKLSDWIEAKEATKKVIKELSRAYGSVWKARVHENLGWYATVRHASGHLSVSLGSYNRVWGRNFLAYLSQKPQKHQDAFAGAFVGTASDDPVKAVDSVIKATEKYAKMWTKTICRVKSELLPAKAKHRVAMRRTAKAKRRKAVQC
jgi:hypothetical protein